MQRGSRMHALESIFAAVRPLLALIVVACLSHAGWTASPAQAQQREMELSLREATAFALQGNLNIQIAGLEPRIREAQVSTEEGIFDIQLHASANASDSHLLSTSPFFQEFINDSVAQDNTQEQAIRLGLSRLNRWGGTYGVEFSEAHVDSTRRVPFPPNTPEPPLRNAFNTAELQVKVTQPLLKNFGSQVTNNRIVIAQNNLSMSQEDFRQQITDVTAQVQEAYWDLVFRRRDLEVRRQQRALAEQLLDQIRKQVAVGTLAPIEVLQAETEIARVEERILVAGNTLRATEDRLKRIMNLSLLGEYADAVLLPVDTPSYDARAINQEEQIRQALEQRVDLMQAKLMLENQRVTLIFSENQALPTLDLETSLRVNGVSKNFDDHLGEFDPGQRHRWDISLQFSQPLGNRQAKNRITQSRLAIRQQMLRIQDMEEEIIRQVRAAVRDVMTHAQRVRVSRVSSQLAQKQLEAEEKKLQVGLSTVFTVLEFQEDLSVERSKEINALTDHLQARIRLEAVKNTLLSSYNITLQPDGPRLQ
jgi:outer membrane protein